MIAVLVATIAVLWRIIERRLLAPHTKELRATPPVCSFATEETLQRLADVIAKATAEAVTREMRPQAKAQSEFLHQQALRDVEHQQMRRVNSAVLAGSDAVIDSVNRLVEEIREKG